MLLNSYLLSFAMLMSPVMTDDGKALYQTHCSVCHQAGGGGVPMMQPPLVASKKVVGDKAEVIAMVLRGSAAVPDGDSEWDNLMPGFASLSDRELAEILTYIRTNFGNKASDITEKDVADSRAD